MAGWPVSVSQLSRWFGVPWRTLYYRPTKVPPKVRPELAEPIKPLIEREPSFGYRTVAGFLGMNKNTVKRIFQLKGWQVRKREIGNPPSIEALPNAGNSVGTQARIHPVLPTICAVVILAEKSHQPATTAPIADR